MTRKLTELTRSSTLPFLAASGVVLLCVVWTFWPALVEMAQRWAGDPQYSHGYLVPGFALLLLWLRRERLTSDTVQTNWWGLPLLLLGLGFKLAGGYYYYVWVDAVALLPCVAGLCLLLGGWTAWRWAWPAIAFLFFMIPLPFGVSGAMAEPLQRFATITSTFLLQTFGFPALAEGNVILLNDVELGVVEACSGLRMLVIFFALASGVVLLIRRPLWEKVALILSAAPIALVVNILRITVTGILYETVGSAWAHAVFHDLAGWLMMPVALGFLATELQLFRRLLLEVPPPDQSSLRVGLRRQPAPSRPAPSAVPGQPAPSRRRAARLAARSMGEA